MTVVQEVLETISVISSTNLSEITQALEILLYVPEEELKPRIIIEIVKYHQKKFNDGNFPIEFFITYQEGAITGFVSVQIDEGYNSYGMRCPTFGWIHCIDFETCEALMEACEQFVRKHRMRKLRGPINYPKPVGGIGYQIMGFEAPLYSGIAFNEPSPRILEYLEQLSYKRDAKYTCVHVIQQSWDKGREIDNNIIFRFKTLEELIAMRSEIMELVQNSFFSVLADAPGGESKFDEMMEAYRIQFQTYGQLKQDVIPEGYFSIPQFLDAYKHTEFENDITFVCPAFDKATGELVGAIMGQPNMYQIWKGHEITHANVDTVMVKKGYAGKGIFSALNNLGQLINRLQGITYFEGTTIYSNNDRAIQAIFPHCSPVRDHIVLQKRILRKT